MYRPRTVFPLLLLLVTADGLLWFPSIPVVRTLGAIALLFVLSGVPLARLLLGEPHSPDDSLLILLTGASAGVGVASIAILLLIYLPGGVNRTTLVLLFNAIALVGIAALAVWGNADVTPGADVRLPRHFWFALIFVLLLGATLRLTWLGYSEFQGDEARVMLRAQDALAGFENPVFIHHKTPGEILIAAGVLSATDMTGEAAARLPFALVGLASIVALLLLGWRLFGGVAATVAATLLALDGYAVAFARIVQYQSVVILASLLVILLLWREGKRAEDNPDRSAAPWRGLLLVGFVALGGLYSHYDVLAVGMPVLWLLWRLFAKVGWRNWLVAVVPAAVVIVGGLVVFLLPWVQHGGFAMARDYVIVARLGTQPPYDNLYDFARRTATYSSIYALLLLSAVTLVEASVLYVRQLGRGRALVAFALVLAVVAAAWFASGGALQYAALPVALALVTVAFLPKLSSAERTVWLWFAPLFVLTLFAVQTPDTHVYIFFLPWFLVVGAASQRIWLWLGRGVATDVDRARLRFGLTALGAGAALAVVVLWGWTWQVFADAPAERYRQWETERPVGYWYPFDAPPERANMGFPLRNGWKSIGVAYAEGDLTGGFETNAKSEVVDWYTRGAGSCPALPERYLLAETVEIADDVQLAELRTHLASTYTPEGAVTVGGVERLTAYAYELLPSWRVSDEAVADSFATLAVSEPEARRGRVLDYPGEASMYVTLGDGIVLRGYVGSAATAHPGETISFDLYWESTSIVLDDYTVFLQLIDPATNTKAGQTDALPVCGQNSTTFWRPGDRIVDPQTLTIFPDASAGEYTLFVGMYNVESGVRLPVSQADGSLSDWFPLTTITIE